MLLFYWSIIKHLLCVSLFVRYAGFHCIITDKYKSIEVIGKCTKIIEAFIISINSTTAVIRIPDQNLQIFLEIRGRK